MSDGEDGGYVHDPGAFDEAGEPIGEGTDGEAGLEEAPHPAAVDREFDWRGWILVGAIVLAFVVAPALILWRPPGLPYRVTLLVLPLVPAVLLAVVAVWATTRP